MSLLCEALSGAHAGEALRASSVSMAA